MPRAAAWIVNQLILQSPPTAAQSPRTIVLQLSNTTYADAAFTSVLTATLRNDGTVQHFFFPPTAARYARLLLLDNYGAATMGLERLQIISPQVGATSAQFLDRSDAGDGARSTYAWAFGDGATSAARDGSHTFAAAGAYTVPLTLTDPQGRADAAALVHHAYAAPLAQFTVIPGAGAEGQSLQFRDTSRDDYGPLAAWRRDWGEGTSTYGQSSPTHTFADNGIYTVTLTVTNIRGISAQTHQPIVIANVPPLAIARPDRSVPWNTDWGVTPGITDAGFADRASLACAWDFGDGQQRVIAPCTSSAARVAYTYADVGVYTAMLTVYDKVGATTSGCWPGVSSPAMLLRVS